MSELPTLVLIEALADRVAPVTPLATPSRRAALTLLAAIAAAAILILLWGDRAGLIRRYSGRETLMLAEMAAMILTAALAITGAFILSIPGRSRTWLIAPLPSFILWLGLSGAGCAFGPGPDNFPHTMNCLLFILGASLVSGLPLLWLLSRARPVEPLPVALLGGLGAAAWSAFLLQFFHPFQLTLIDLVVHAGAVLLVIATAAAANRPLLAPA